MWKITDLSALPFFKRKSSDHTVLVLYPIITSIKDQVSNLWKNRIEKQKKIKRKDCVTSQKNVCIGRQTQQTNLFPFH